jgi:predicted MFS family arabinose efflux permease
VVLLTAIPFACASIFHLINARHSQQSNERRLHIALPWAMAAAALLLLPLAVAHQASSWAFALLVLAHVGINGANGCQTSWVASLLAGPHRAAGLAMYNCIGNLGGAMGPVVVGVLCDALGSYGVSMLVMGGCLTGAAMMVLCFKPHAMRRRWPAAAHLDQLDSRRDYVEYAC